MSESNGTETGTLSGDRKQQADKARRLVERDSQERDDSSRKSDPARKGSGLPPLSKGSAGEASNGPATPGRQADVTRDAPTAPNVARRGTQDDIDEKSHNADSSRRKG
jgi:hypothetical protein